MEDTHKLDMAEVVFHMMGCREARVVAVVEQEDDMGIHKVFG